MKIFEWVLAVLLALIFALAAIARLVSSTQRAEQAEILNVPGWFMILVSGLELAIAADLLWPRFRILGGVGYFITMVGAAIMNFFATTVGDTNPRTFIPLNIVLALLGLLVAWLAGGRPKAIGSLVSTAKNQAMGQVDSVADTARDIAA